MNILQWLKSKSGKLPITLAQAAGITAVVGAAGLGAMTFLSSPADNNNTFMPPMTNQGEVVYVSQGGGGGQYEANGEVGSSFKAAPSRAIRLANEQAARQEQARVLEESAGQQTYSGQPGEELNPQLPKAYRLSNSDLGLGMGAGADKQLNSSLETFSTIQNQLAGVNNAIAQAQAGPGAKGTPAGAPAQGNPSGQSAAQLANVSRNWGSGGSTHAGGGSSSSNSFVIQNSGKNVKGENPAAAVAQAGDAIAQAQAAMTKMQEGTRMRSRANFGSSDKLGADKDAAAQRARRFGQGRDELSFIRKQTAAINKNKTNSANEGGRPFLASAKISGGLTVNGEQVTTGQGSSSGDLKSTFDKQMRGIGARLGKISEDADEQKFARDDLKAWLWNMLTVGLAAILTITALVSIAKAGGPFTAWAWAAAGAATAAILGYIWWKGGVILGNYHAVCKADKWTTLWWALSGVMTAGVGAAWFVFSGKQLGLKIREMFNIQSEAITGAPDALAPEAVADKAAAPVEEIKF